MGEGGTKLTFHGHCQGATATATATATGGAATATLILPPTRHVLSSLRLKNVYFRRIWWRGEGVARGKMSEIIYSVVKVAAHLRLPIAKIQGLVKAVFQRFEYRGIHDTQKTISQVATTYANVLKTCSPPPPKRVSARHWIELFYQKHGRLPKPRELADFAGIKKNAARTALKRYRGEPPQTETNLQQEIETEIEKENHSMRSTTTIVTTFPKLHRAFHSLKTLVFQPTQAQLDELMSESPWRFRVDGDEQAAKAILRYAEYMRKKARSVPQGYQWYRDKLTTNAWSDIEFLEAATPKPPTSEEKAQDMPAWATNADPGPETAEAIAVPAHVDTTTPPKPAPATHPTTEELAKLIAEYEADLAAELAAEADESRNA